MLNFVKNYANILKREFKGYNGKKFSNDLMAGVTVAAVALPLALAFGVSSGATAAAGIVTAIFAGLVIGGLSGASYQISGPTGAMTAILVSLVAQYGMQGVFIASFIAGLLLLICGIFKLGGLVSYLPMPVITGFTSGIAIIIALGQVNNLTGLKSEGLNTIETIVSYFNLPQTLNVPALIVGVCVIVFMFIYPKKLSKYCPSSLIAIILSTLICTLFKIEVPTVGAIPKTLFLEERLDFLAIDFSQIGNFITPAISIAALGLIESLLCGSSAGRMKNEKMDADVELVAQGIGNMIIPVFGGVPATAAIARTSVAIKSGAQTRLVSIIHALVLLLSMFVLGDVMSMIPLSALAGVLIVTAWRMNEWHSIKAIFGKKLKTAIAQFLITMVATVVFDLTIAILIGVVFSAFMFIVKVSDMQIKVNTVNSEELETVSDSVKNTAVVTLSGPLYFGTSAKLEELMDKIDDHKNVIFEMSNVSVADLSGIEAFKEKCEALINSGCEVYISAINPEVRNMFDRCGFIEKEESKLYFENNDKAFVFIASK
ncbi:MAG: SulP family inorganic anion transporter [Ruminococcaceae bacterium]|nr:SulP family inorganic anion transporter [Oscillospiraceae bacterium]